MGTNASKSIGGELLPWAIPETPFENLRHAISVSPYQAARLFLFDFERDEDDPGAVIVKVHSERAPEPKQYRACMRLDKGNELSFKVAVSGENPRRPSCSA
ncbi:MAG: hypothetical protein ACP5UD_08305 [Conexivisphaera sp.]